MSFLARRALAFASAIALVNVVGTSGCLIYDESLLLEGGAGGTAGAGGMSSGGGGTGGACSAPCGHLLISEFAVQPTTAEMIEVFNPLDSAVALDDVYLADFAEYHTVTSGSPTVGGTDFLVRFPAGTSIASGERLVVALASGTTADFTAEDMPGTFSAGMSGFANGDEMLVLFSWDGVSETVADLDYVIWGNTSDAVDKSGLPGYANDTPAAEQRPLAVPGSLQSQHRCDLDEPGEKQTDGNGATGHDETSENLPAAFAIGSSSPGSSPGAGVCP